jgi:transcriptional regulator with XRE-family HTH domain
MSAELGRFLEQRRRELGLSRHDVAERSHLSYPYVSQLENGDRDPALKAMRALAPVLDMPVEELAGLVAGGDWTGSSPVYLSAMASAPSTVWSAEGRSDTPTATRSYNRDRVLLSLERRLRDVPPLDRISLLNLLIARTVEELSADGS